MHSIAWTDTSNLSKNQNPKTLNETKVRTPQQLWLCSLSINEDAAPGGRKNKDQERESYDKHDARKI